MEIKKMSLANIKGKLSRAEMKKIMAGSGGGGGGCQGFAQVCVWWNCCPGLRCIVFGDGATGCSN